MSRVTHPAHRKCTRPASPPVAEGHGPAQRHPSKKGSSSYPAHSLTTDSTAALAPTPSSAHAALAALPTPAGPSSTCKPNPVASDASTCVSTNGRVRAAAAASAWGRRVCGRKGGRGREEGEEGGDGGKSERSRRRSVEGSDERVTASGMRASLGGGRGAESRGVSAEFSDRAAMKGRAETCWDAPKLVLQRRRVDRPTCARPGERPPAGQQRPARSRRRGPQRAVREHARECTRGER